MYFDGDLAREFWDRVQPHVGHAIEVVVYGDRANLAIECLDCSEVLIDADAPVCPVCLGRDPDVPFVGAYGTSKDPCPTCNGRGTTGS